MSGAKHTQKKTRFLEAEISQQVHSLEEILNYLNGFMFFTK